VRAACGQPPIELLVRLLDEAPRLKYRRATPDWFVTTTTGRPGAN